MRSFSGNLLRRGIGHRCLCALLLIAYVLTASGVPLPAPDRSPNQPEAFPCAASACGCDSAERCWRSCCCHTLEERMAWARKHGVRPPAFALAQARAAGINLAWLGDSSNAAQKRPNCCLAERSADKTCCAAKAKSALSTVEQRSCCSEREVLVRDDESNRSDDGNRLIGLRALACRGQALDWLAAVPTLIMPPSEHFIDLPVVEYLAPPASDLAGGISDSPAVPPPERA